jgi:transglutaminase-like putative cysteine protease
MTEVPARTINLLLLAYLAAALLNLHHIALWCLPLAFGAAIWRSRFMRPRLVGRSRRWPRVVVVFALTLSVLIAFHTLNGVEAGATLLVCMGALKLTETRARRDWYIVCVVTAFLLLASCLDGQELWRVPLYAVELYLLCVAMYALGAAPATPRLATLLRRSGASLLAALPFALLLFLFVPRLAGSFWAIPHKDAARTGLSDEMDPGSISELAESGATVARIRFASPIPPPEQRYWRGFVLHSFDGRAWRRGRSASTEPRAPVVNGDPYHYEVSLEPAPYAVLLALELPATLPADLPTARLNDDYVLWNSAGANVAVHYRLDSYTQHQDPVQLGDNERQLDLKSYASSRNPRSIELAHTLRAQSDSDSAFVGRVLNYLRQGGFRYTLEPPVLGRDAIDDLLFKTHEGFCAHYASAFALLMRAGGVPARVVTGYQGGQWNRYGNYLLIRQSDAHAWTEVWLDGVGWQRVDPTAVVSPGRIAGGSETLFDGDQSFSNLVLRSRWLSSTLQAWQAANAWWQDDFVGFNLSRQEGLLGDFGVRHGVLRVLTILLIGGASLWLAIMGWSMRPRTRPDRADAVKRSWLLIERKLKQAADPREPAEGVIDYADRVSRARPDMAAAVTALARRYTRLRYGPAQRDQAREAQQFHQSARQLRVISSGVRTRANSNAPPMKKNSSTRIDSR